MNTRSLLLNPELQQAVVPTIVHTDRIVFEGSRLKSLGVNPLIYRAVGPLDRHGVRCTRINIYIEGGAGL